jgi:hypothetical protein
MGAMSSDPIQSLLFSPSMIADFLADDEPLASALLVSIPIAVLRRIGLAIL